MWLFEDSKHIYWQADVDDMFSKIVQCSSQATYTYAYYPEFDTISHDFGNASQEASDMYDVLDQKIQKLRNQLDDRTCLMISSDHGFMDQSDDKNLILGDKVLDYLMSPPYGERRYVYFDVASRFEAEFLTYMSIHI